jgi:hypothetical protein
MMRRVNSVRQTGGRHFPLVMPGQKRVEDARERAYDPASIFFAKRFTKTDGLPGQARQ